MERVSAFAKNDGTIFAGIFHIRRCSFKCCLTNSTHFVIDIPRPSSDGVKAFDPQLEAGRREIVAALVDRRLRHWVVVVVFFARRFLNSRITWSLGHLKSLYWNVLDWVRNNGKIHNQVRCNGNCLRAMTPYSRNVMPYPLLFWRLVGENGFGVN